MEFKELGARVTEDGRVFDYKGKELAQRQDQHGYWRVSVYCTENKGTYTFLIHRLVATEYIPNPDGKTVVNHKDADKTNNKIENLEWMTAQENGQHAYDHGLRPFTPRKGGKRDYKGRFNG